MNSTRCIAIQDKRTSDRKRKLWYVRWFLCMHTPQASDIQAIAEHRRGRAQLPDGLRQHIRNKHQSAVVILRHVHGLNERDVVSREREFNFHARGVIFTQSMRHQKNKQTREEEKKKRIRAHWWLTKFIPSQWRGQGESAGESRARAPAAAIWRVRHSTHRRHAAPSARCCRHSTAAVLLAEWI